ncbi:AsmA family protein [Salmonella enterica]|nr:AsmA family protein [Salmonella enterica]
MRRFLTTLMILLVVLVAGFSALVLLVNPNDFRAYMVQQVAARSEYQLQLDGPLRWHVWPQLSILSGRMTLTARGASEPLVRADNMRLDVALWPLLSHQLHVKQVMLKGGVIQLTPQTEAVRSDDAPVAPKDNTLPDVAEDRGWSFDIRSLRVADSVLVFQHENDDQVTVRDIRLNMEQDAEHRGTFDFSGRVNRDQRDLALSFSGTLDLVKQSCDTQFNLRVLGGWNGDSNLITFLKETPVPLRVYGKWQELNYTLQVDQLLRKHLQDEAKRRLNDWADRNKDTRNGKDVKKLLNKL